MSLKVSVVIPIRNGEGDVPGLVAQLKDLQLAEAEILIVDDQSTDSTRQRLLSAMSSLPAMRVLEGRGEGVAAARNLAVRESRAEFIWFADSDDFWSPTIVADLLEAADMHDADLVLCNAAKRVLGSEDDELIRDAQGVAPISAVGFLQMILVGHVQGHLWNKLFRRTVLGDGPFPPTRAHSDLGGILRVVPRLSRIASVDKTLYTYLVRQGSILNSRSYRWEDLTDCRDLARSAVTALNMSANDKTLRIFSCTHVILPLLNESIRRGALIGRSKQREVWQTCKDLYTWRDLNTLAKAGHAGASLKLAVFRLHSPTYAFAYRWYRRRRWAGLDEF